MLMEDQGIYCVNIFFCISINVEIQENIFTDFYFFVLIDSYVYSKIVT